MRIGWSGCTQSYTIHCFIPCPKVQNTLLCFISNCTPQFRILHALHYLYLSNLICHYLWLGLSSQTMYSPQILLHVKALVQCIQGASIVCDTLAYS